MIASVQSVLSDGSLSDDSVRDMLRAAGEKNSLSAERVDELIRSAAAGQMDIPKPADSIINLPLTTDAEAQQALVDYHGWKSSVDSIAGIPTQWLLIGAAGVAAWWFFFRK